MREELNSDSDFTNDWRLTEDEHLYKSIYKHSPLCLAFSSLDGKILRLNQKFCTLLGYKKEELIGKGFADLTPEYEMQREIINVNQCIKERKENYRSEKIFYHKKGHLIWVDLTMSFVYDQESGEPLYIIAMASDISDKVKITMELEESQAQLKAQNEKLEKTIQIRTKELQVYNEKLQQSNHDLQQFAFIASHDLKEPLRTIGSFATLLDKRFHDKLSIEGQEYIHFITNGVTRMSNLIQSLLTYSKVNNSMLVFASANINTVVSTILKDISLVIKEKNVKINIGRLPKNIYCVEGKINMLFMNLITNAIKFNESENPIIDISCLEDDTHYTFSIKDNGIGIAPAFQEKIFVLFKRLNNSHKYEGTGIGLSLCKKIIHQHGGTIHLESQEGQGTCFYFKIAKNLNQQNQSLKFIA